MQGRNVGSTGLGLHILDIMQCSFHLVRQKFVLFLFCQKVVWKLRINATQKQNKNKLKLEFKKSKTADVSINYAPSSLSTSFWSFCTERSANSARASAYRETIENQ